MYLLRLQKKIWKSSKFKSTQKRKKENQTARGKANLTKRSQKRKAKNTTKKIQFIFHKQRTINEVLWATVNDSE